MPSRTPLLMLCALAISASAAPPADLLQGWRTEARAQTPEFTDFSAGRGKVLYTTKPSDWSCSTCHTVDPRNTGRHAVTSKVIKPLSPLANPARFSDPEKTEKWFRRNCRDVLDRECTAAEKGDLLTWILGAGQAVTP